MNGVKIGLLATAAIVGMLIVAIAVGCQLSETTDESTAEARPEQGTATSVPSTPSQRREATSTPAPTSKPRPTPTKAPTATPTPEPRPALSEGDVGIFLAINGGSSSDLLRTVLSDPSTGGGGTKYITVERSSKAVVMFVPGSDEAVVMDSYSSPSYAPHTKRPYTMDDRLFVSTKYSTSLDYTEYDPQTLQAKGSVGAKATVLTRENSYQLKGALSRDPVTSISKVNTISGATQLLAAFDVDGIDNYVPGSWYYMALDNDKVYWSAISYQGGRLVGEVWSFDLNNPEADLMGWEFYVPHRAEEIVNIIGFDVDDGYAVIQPRYQGGDDSRLVLYEMNTGSVDLIDTGLDIFDVQVLYLGEPS